MGVATVERTFLSVILLQVSSIRALSPPSLNPEPRIPNPRQHMEFPYATNATFCNLAATTGHWDLFIPWTLGLGHWSFATPAPSAQHTPTKQTHQYPIKPTANPPGALRTPFSVPSSLIFLTKQSHRVGANPRPIPEPQPPSAIIA